MSFNDYFAIRRGCLLLIKLGTTMALISVYLIGAFFLSMSNRIRPFIEVLLQKKQGPPPEKLRKIQEVMVCNDVWLHIFRFVEPAQLGLKLALLSRRFDCLVDTHFRSRKWLLGNWRIVWPGPNEWTPRGWRQLIWKLIKVPAYEPLIYKLSDDSYTVIDKLPVPEATLPASINGFKHINIQCSRPEISPYCSMQFVHNVIAFLRHNLRLFTSAGFTITLKLDRASKSNKNDGTDSDYEYDNPPHDFFVANILPLIMPSTTKGSGGDGGINKIVFYHYESWQEMFFLSTADTSTNGTCTAWATNLRSVTFDATWFASAPSARNWASAAHPLSKWLHMARNDGQPKLLNLKSYRRMFPVLVEGLKTLFINASTPPVNFIVVLVRIPYNQYLERNPAGREVDPFVLNNHNGHTRERLSLQRVITAIENGHFETDVPAWHYQCTWLIERSPPLVNRNEKQWKEWRREALLLDRSTSNVLSFTV